MAKDIYYTGNTLKSMRYPFNWVIGARSMGKTVAFIYMLTKRFIDSDYKDQFVYVRRYQEDIDAVEDIFGFAATMFPNHTFETRVEKKIKRGYVDGKEAVLCFAVSTAQRRKSGASYSDIRSIFFDEFLSENRQYLGTGLKEPAAFASLIKTIQRDKLGSDLTIYMAANAVELHNKYFKFFNIKADPTKRFTKIKSDTGQPLHLIELPKSEDIQIMQDMKEDVWGQIMMATPVGEYMYDNKFDDNNDALVRERDGDTRQIASVNYNNELYHIWYDMTNSITYIDTVGNDYSPIVISVNIEDIQDGQLSRKSVPDHIKSALIRSRNASSLFYTSQLTRTVAQEFLKIMGIL